MKTLKIETMNGMSFEVTGEVTTKVIDGETIYFCKGNSFPACIVKEVIDL